MRIVWLISGLASLALGGLGVVLPLLPTTPFVLLAAFCFARSSPALHIWLLRNPTFGKAIRDWRTNRAISRGGKTTSTLAMVLSLAVSLALAVDPVIIIVQALALSGAATYILTRNTAA
ncbi:MULTISPECIES: YbaN family protein [Mesorhizobium]|uniref:DUF454 domain-containing protein n=1 Tax=Mesorhizobium denitrificans TaxID=2294114 RepID=A0A371XEJ1_9HYPH|nr:MULTISPECIES: YbaN family protein [Mesorhizobium]RFC67661.1 DUF454 domain-containing protein [Mesorhizobium denitrificans]